MPNKSKFLKSATLAIASVVLVSSLSSCKMMHYKNSENSKDASVKEEKSSHIIKDGKMKCSSKMKEVKTKEVKVEKAKKAKAVKAEAAPKKAE